MVASSPSKLPEHALGDSGEALVAQYLSAQGFTICSCNFRCKTGEIDIIAQNKTARIFVEVKTRQTAYFNLSHVITPSKQKKIIAAALYYNALHATTESLVYRFDVALVIMAPHQTAKITYIPNAFTAPSNY